LEKKNIHTYTYVYIYIYIIHSIAVGRVAQSV